MVYSDIDGVLRDLLGSAAIRTTTWDCSIGPEKFSFIQFFNKHPVLLVTAQPTKYFDVIAMYHKYIEPIEIISNQVEEWIGRTEFWLHKNFSPYTRVPTVHYTVDKLRFLKPHDTLIEDNPNLTDYTNVIVIDTSYNRGIELPHIRVETPKQLLNVLIRRKYGFT